MSRQAYLAIFVIFQTLFTYESAKLVLPANILREHPNKCFSLALCKVFNIDDSWELPGCGRGSCSRSRNGLDEIIQTCPEIYFESDCYLSPVEVKLAYPMCCPKKVCPGDKNYMGHVCKNQQNRPPPNPHV
uniref:Single domain-containing protein n=1 Tax=Strigamia maritima TaxID=126957 RepID=T1J4P6_STRMM